MSATTTRVTVQDAIREMTDRSAKRFRVAWTVDGKRRQKMFATTKLAMKFRNQLIADVVAGKRFSTEPPYLAVDEGAPVVVRPVTCLEVATDIIRAEESAAGATMPAKSLEAMVIGMSTIVQALVPDSVVPTRPARAQLQGALERHLNPRRHPTATRLTTAELTTRATVDGAAVAWVARNSLAVSDVSVTQVRAALEMCATRVHGGRRAPTSFRRQRQELNRLLAEAVDQGLLSASPMPRSRRQRGVRSKLRARQVGRDEVPTREQAAAFVACVTHAPTRLQLELQRLQGLRPGEAAAVRVRDVHLDGEEPVLEIRGSRTEAPREYTIDGQAFEDKSVKTEHDGETDAVARVVPLFSATVELLRPQLVRSDGSPRERDELLCATRNGTPVSSRNRSRSMKKARAQWLASLSDGERANVPGKLLTDSYHLRHAHATLLLRVPLPPREVAARLGTSERMLTDTYSSVAPGLRVDDTSAADRLISGQWDEKDT